MALVDDDGRHRMDAVLQIELLALAHLVGVAVRGQQRTRLGRIQPHFARHTHQHLVVARVLSVGEIRLEQRLLQRGLHALLFGPVQQAVCIKGVVDAAALVHAEGEPQRRTARRNGLAVLLALLGRGAVLFLQVLANVLTLRPHLRVQLERLKVQVQRDLALKPVRRLLQRLEADDAPGAGDIGDEIDFEGGGHSERGSERKIKG